jgi:hypothetical protein
MQLIINILAAYFFAYNFVIINEFVKTIKKIFKINHTTRLKPIDCVYCLSCWTSLVLFCSPDIAANLMFVFFGTGYLAYKLENI